MKIAWRIALILQLVVLAATADPKFPIPDTSLQAVVVLSANWDDPTARMLRFERVSAAKPWSPVGHAVPVNLGRTGLAWGRSKLISDKDPSSTVGPTKKEGDGKAPAGLFPFLQAFGYPTSPKGYSDSNLPFLVVESQQCVDDATSEHYNTIVEPAKVGGATWNSAETMKIDLYRMGLVVGHNCPDAKPGKGSCIFFHLQSGAKAPTSGCTAMDAASLSNLLLWLKRDAQPVVLQLPQSEFKKRHHESWPVWK